MRKITTVLAFALVLGIAGLAAAQTVSPDNSTAVPVKINTAGGDADIYKLDSYSGAGSYDLNTGTYQACVFDTTGITTTHTLDRVSWYGYLYSAQNIDYYIAPEVGGQPGAATFIGTTYETATGTATWHSHTPTGTVTVDPGRYYYLIANVSLSGAGFWWCSNIQSTNPHASMTSGDLVTWTPDYQYQGYENLAAIWIEGTPGGGGFTLTVTPDPLVGGGTGTFAVTGGTPNDNTWLAYSLVGPGSTYVPALQVTLDLASPARGAGPNMTDGNGDYTWTLPVPAVGPRNVWLQAVQFGQKTNMVATSIQ